MFILSLLAAASFGTAAGLASGKNLVGLLVFAGVFFTAAFISEIAEKSARQGKN